MLDLMRWKRVSKTSAYFDARPPEEGAYILTLATLGWKKTLASAETADEPEGQGPAGNC
jgi:hypothetical protein